MKKSAYILIALLLNWFSNSAQTTEDSLNSALFSAVFSQNIDSVSLLLEQGADVNAVNVYGITPLLYAVDLGNVKLVKLLLDHGANVNYLPPYDPGALTMAILHNQDSILRLLLEHNANPDLTDRFGLTPLSYAIYYGNYNAADLLLYYGADPNKRFNSWSPVDLSCYFDDTLMLKMLIYYGAKLNTADSQGFTPLHICAQRNSVNTASILIHKGANVNAKNIDNANPAILAIYTKNNQILDTLAKYNADLKSPVLNNITPSTIALVVQNYKAKRFLKKRKLYQRQTIINFLIGIPVFFNYQDFLSGFGIGIKELSTNIDFQVQLVTRLSPRRIIFEVSDHNFIQMWEQRWILSGSLVKNFYLFTVKKSNVFFRLGVNSLFSYANYRGSLQKNVNYSVLPLIGTGFDVNNFIFNLDFTRLKLPGLNQFPYFVNLGINFRLSPVNVSLRQKQLYLNYESKF